MRKDAGLRSSSHFSRLSVSVPISAMTGALNFNTGATSDLIGMLSASSTMASAANFGSVRIGFRHRHAVVQSAVLRRANTLQIDQAGSLVPSLGASLSNSFAGTTLTW